MTFANHHARPMIIKLARQGRLVDEAFKVFQRQVFPGAPPDQIATMRTCFFAGAAELWALTMHGLDADHEPTEEDMQLMSDWADEIERFHKRTLDTAAAKGALS